MMDAWLWTLQIQYKLQYGSIPHITGERNPAFKHLKKLNNFFKQGYQPYVRIPVLGQMRKMCVKSAQALLNQYSSGRI